MYEVILVDGAESRAMLERHLGVALSDLERALTHRRITAAHARRKSVFSKPCSRVETECRRDCLVKLLYARCVCRAALHS